MKAGACCSKVKAPDKLELELDPVETSTVTFPCPPARPGSWRLRSSARDLDALGVNPRRGGRHERHGHARLEAWPPSAMVSRRKSTRVRGHPVNLRLPSPPGSGRTVYAP